MMLHANAPARAGNTPKNMIRAMILVGRLSLVYPKEAPHAIVVIIKNPMGVQKTASATIASIMPRMLAPTQRSHRFHPMVLGARLYVIIVPPIYTFVTAL
jgi:hypothetical protein